MPKIIPVVLIIFGLFLIYYLIFLRRQPASIIKVQIKNQTFNLEVAKTISQKAKGLSRRPDLCSDCGMIFIFTNESQQPFWMKDTLIPLDIVWLNKIGQVVFLETALPQPNTPLNQLKIYQNNDPAIYVIELKAGTSANLGLTIGDILNLPSNL